MSVIDCGEKIIRIPCIPYPVWFQESQKQVRALPDTGDKVNAMSSTYIERLGLKIWKTNIRAQKIDGSTFKTFKIGITKLLGRE